MEDITGNTETNNDEPIAMVEAIGTDLNEREPNYWVVMGGGIYFNEKEEREKLESLIKSLSKRLQGEFGIIGYVEAIKKHIIPADLDMQGKTLVIQSGATLPNDLSKIPVSPNTEKIRNEMLNLKFDEPKQSYEYPIDKKYKGHERPYKYHK